MFTKTKKSLDHLVGYSFRPLFFSLLLAFSPTSSFSETPTPKAPEVSPYVDTFTLNLLLPPSSPAFAILGISPVSIERPGNPTDFAVSILSSTENLTIIPRNYALEITPRWLFKRDNLEAGHYSGDDDIARNFLQTLSVSLATVTEPEIVSDTFTTSLAVGTRFSLFRGGINSKYDEELDSLLSTFNSTSHEKWTDLLNDPTLKYLKALEDSVIQSKDSIFQDPTLKKDSSKVIEILIKDRRRTLRTAFDTEFAITEETLYKDIEDVASRMHLTRTGFKLDVAAAAAWDFPQGSFDDYTFTKWGAWINFGYENQYLGGLGTARLRFDNQYPDSSSIDGGGRFLYYSPQQLTLSAELVFRYLQEPRSLHYHWDVTADYPVFKNNVVSFTIGKDYGAFQEGELIASISFKQGFGSKRPIHVGPTEE